MCACNQKNHVAVTEIFLQSWPKGSERFFFFLNLWLQNKPTPNPNNWNRKYPMLQATSPVIWRYMQQPHWNSWSGWWNKMTHFWALTSLAEIMPLFKHDQHSCLADEACGIGVRRAGLLSQFWCWLAAGFWTSPSSPFGKKRKKENNSMGMESLEII